MAKRYSRTYRSAAQAQAKVAAAREELLAGGSTTVEEPMHRYSNPIPRVTSIQEVAASTCSCGEDTPAAMTQVLEQLSCQSQLLVDLLGAVNSLTAAMLARSDKN